MQDLAGDVGVVCGNLAPPLGAAVRGQAYEADILVTERLDALDLHPGANLGRGNQCDRCVLIWRFGRIYEREGINSVISLFCNIAGAAYPTSSFSYGSFTARQPAAPSVAKN